MTLTGRIAPNCHKVNCDAVLFKQPMHTLFENG